MKLDPEPLILISKMVAITVAMWILYICYLNPIALVIAIYGTIFSIGVAALLAVDR